MSYQTSPAFTAAIKAGTALRNSKRLNQMTNDDAMTALVTEILGGYMGASLSDALTTAQEYARHANATMQLDLTDRQELLLADLFAKAVLASRATAPVVAGNATCNDGLQVDHLIRRLRWRASLRGDYGQHEAALDTEAATAIESLSAQGEAEAVEAQTETCKLYHSRWPVEDLLKAREPGGLITDDGEAWKYHYTHSDAQGGPYDLVYRPVASAQPANPAQVTDAMVSAAIAHLGHSPILRHHVRTALTAAIGAGGQAVAKVCAICGGPRDNDMLSDICQECETSVPWREDITPAHSGQAVANSGQFAERVIAACRAYMNTYDVLADEVRQHMQVGMADALRASDAIAHPPHPPHPADERVVEALRVKIEKLVCCGLYDNGKAVVPLEDVFAALAQEGRKDG